MKPACDPTGTPRHFHSSTTSGSACLMSARTRASISPRQSPSSSILLSISRDGAFSAFAAFAPAVRFLVAVVAFFMLRLYSKERLRHARECGHPRLCRACREERRLTSERGRDPLEAHHVGDVTDLLLLVVVHAHDQRERRGLELLHLGAVRIDLREARLAGVAERGGARRRVVRHGASDGAQRVL